MRATVLLFKDSSFGDSLCFRLSSVGMSETGRENWTHVII